MKVVVEGIEDAIKQAHKVEKLAQELRMATYDLMVICNFHKPKETDPAVATTEPEKND